MSDDGEAPRSVGKQGYRRTNAIPSAADVPALRTGAPGLTHAEILDRIERKGRIRSAILEAQDDTREPKYVLFLLTSWRTGYHIFHLRWPARPRLYSDLDRLLVLLRFDYRYKGPVILRLASEAPAGKGGFPNVNFTDIA